MTVNPLRPRLVIKNISAYDVNLFGRVKIRPGDSVDVYDKLEYNEFGSLTTTVLREFEAPSGEIYRLWKTQNRIQIIEFINPNYQGTGLGADAIQTSNSYFEGAVLGYESGELKWLTGGGGGGGGTAATTTYDDSLISPALGATNLQDAVDELKTATAAGDLSGPYLSPDVVGLQGNPISGVAPVSGQVLTWNGSSWVPGASSSSGSGGGGLVYFLNAGTAAIPPFLGIPTSPDTPKALGLTAEPGLTSISSGILSTGGTYDFVVGFITDAGAPGLPTIPAGLWDFNIWAMSDIDLPGVCYFRIKLYRYDGMAPVLISTSDPISIFNPGPSTQYTASIALPQTTISTSDRIYIELEATASEAGHTVTFDFGAESASHSHTTLSVTSGTGILHVIAGVVQSPASAVDLAGGSSEITGILPVSHGGTGQSSLTSNAVLIGAGGSSLTGVSPGTAGNVLTSDGSSWSSSPSAGGPPSGTAGGDLTGSTYPNPIISSFGGKIHWVVQGGKYATLQAAVNAAAAEDVIMVGPKTSGDWGNVVLNVVNKPLIIAATSGAGANKVVKVGSVTYDLGTTGPALNVNVNETYLYGLYIQGSFTGSAVTLTGGANYPGRLRLYGCYVLNSSTTGAAAVTNSNLGANSSLYLDACVVSLPNSTTGSAVVQTAGYTIIRNRSDVNGSSAAIATGNAMNVSAGTVEIYDSYISIPVRIGAVVGYPTINVTGATTFVLAGYSTILNGSDAAGAACANIGTSGARFGAGDATLAAGSTLPTSAVAVSGVAGGSFLYANVSFSFVATVSTVTSTATPQSGGLFSYGMSVGTLLGTTFVVSASGNITKLNNVTTSFPSAQGSANQVLTNNGSGTLTWSNGNLKSLGSVGLTPTAANLRTNATYTVSTSTVALPAMALGDDGLTISLVNTTVAVSTVTPSTGVARIMTAGGGQTWVWRNTGTTWYCTSNV